MLLVGFLLSEDLQKLLKFCLRLQKVFSCGSNLSWRLSRHLACASCLLVPGRSPFVVPVQPFAGCKELI